MNDKRFDFLFIFFKIRVNSYTLTAHMATECDASDQSYEGPAIGIITLKRIDTV